MFKHIKWYNIIPKRLQRLQAKFYAWRDVFIHTDYHYDEPETIDLVDLRKKERHETSTIKLITVTITIIFIAFIFIFILPLLLI